MKKTVEEYGIDYLVHFTQAENLKSIFDHGIMPLSEQRKRGVIARVNDVYRLDFHEDATSTSIKFPNYRVFFKFRKENPDVDWVLLALYPNILWEKTCAFCSDNAANSNVSSLTIEERMGVDALKNMYAEISGKPSRGELGIDKSFPTNPQAEVLVFATIEPRYIGAAIFENDATLAKYQHNIPDGITPSIQVVSNSKFFSARPDYTHWR